MDDPAIALAILVENSGHGASVAAPISKSFYLEYFKDDDAESVLSYQPAAGETTGGEGQ